LVGEGQAGTDGIPGIRPGSGGHSVNRAGAARVQRGAVAPAVRTTDPMTAIVIIATITVTGAYLRWATGPVLAAYQVGRHIERMLAERAPSRPRRR